MAVEGADETMGSDSGAPAAAPPAEDAASCAGAPEAVAPPSPAADALVAAAGEAATDDVAPVASIAPTPPPEPEFIGPFRIIADSCVMQGRRPKQEDRHVKIPDLTKAARALKMPIDHLEQPCAFFGVYDGHQGHLCAEFVAKSFHMRLLKKLSADTNSETWSDQRFCSVLAEVCEELDVEFLAKYRTSPDGCTAVVALITGTRCTIGWVGDSRCLLGRRTSKGDLLAVALTEDHRPTDKAEAERVQKAGGLIVDLGYTARVAHLGYEERLRDIRRAQAQGLGTIAKEPVALAVSRAFGDRDFKAVTGKALLIPTPGVRCIKLESGHLFLALMCDGIFDVMGNDEVIEELGITREPDPAADVRAGCGALVQHAYNKGSADNLTAIMARFNWRGAGASDHIMKRKIVEVAIDESKAAASKRKRMEARSSISNQKKEAYKRIAGVEDEVRTISPPRVSEVDASKNVDVTMQNASETIEERQVQTDARTTLSVSPGKAVGNGEGGEQVVLVGLPAERGLNGLMGFAIKTISDGRRVVRLPDGRELAFKNENLQLAPAGTASVASAEATLTCERVQLVGLPPERGLNGSQGDVIKTISDGRRVVRLADGRELAFKLENLKPAPPSCVSSEALLPNDRVELFGLPPERGLNGTQGTIVKTISDGRQVVKLPDGRELAFKAENIRSAVRGGVSRSAPLIAQEPARADKVVLVGLPAERGLNGLEGVGLHTISDGRRVVRLADGRELAFKCENIQPARAEAVVGSTAAPVGTVVTRGEAEIASTADAKTLTGPTDLAKKDEAAPKSATAPPPAASAFTFV